MSNAFFADDPPTNRVLKRAQYEQFAFSLQEGDVLVRNESHADPSDHEYRVQVDDGEPTTCECPADEHYDGPCKHRTAVAIRSRIGDVAEAVQAVIDTSADTGDDNPVQELSAANPAAGSRETTDHVTEDDHPDGRPADCECAEFNASIDLACWPCYRDGYEEPASGVNDSA